MQRTVETSQAQFGFIAHSYHESHRLWVVPAVLLCSVMETVLAGGVLSEDSNANVALFIRLVPLSPVRTVASRLLVGLHSSRSGSTACPICPTATFNNYEFSKCATFLSVFFGDVSGVTTGPPGSRLTSHSLLCSLGIVGCSHVWRDG